MRSTNGWSRRGWLTTLGIAGLGAAGLACSRTEQFGEREELIVAAAMSLREVMARVERAYEAAHPEINVTLNLAGSQALAAQILAGAATDVFVSADRAQMQRLVDAELAEPAVEIASNRLVAIAARGSDMHQAKDLGRDGAKVVLAAPEVPAGAYARQALDRLGLRREVEANVVSEEDNVRAVVQKVSLGEADAGIVYATDVRAADPGSVARIELPGAESIRATYVAAALRRARDPSRARAFVERLRGAEAQAFFAELGFGPIAAAGQATGRAST
ncbi:MAG: molybdate ABC transporter substrate-binding protein [Nannocystaceae bacterium]